MALDSMRILICPRRKSRFIDMVEFYFFEVKKNNFGKWGRLLKKFIKKESY